MRMFVQVIPICSFLYIKQKHFFLSFQCFTFFYFKNKAILEAIITMADKIMLKPDVEAEETIFLALFLLQSLPTQVQTIT